MNDIYKKKTSGDGQLRIAILKRNANVSFYVLSFLIVSAGFIFRLLNALTHKVFIQDEFYYVKDGWSMFKYGYEVKWIPDALDLPNIASELSKSNWFFYNNITPVPYSLDYWSQHPPVGKWIIGLGIQLFGIDNPLGWRFGAILAGTIIIGLSIWLAYQITGKRVAAILAGVFVAFDGFNLSMSIVSMLDIFLAMFALLATNLIILFIRKYDSWVIKQKLMLAFMIGIAVGLSAGVKWSGAFVILPLGFYLLYKFFTKKEKLQQITFVLASSVGLFLAYTLSFLGWFINSPNGLMAGNFSNTISIWIQTHIDSFNSAYIFSGASYLKSTALEWVVASYPSPLRAPLLEEPFVIYTIPNLVLWFTGLIAMTIMLGSMILKRKINWMEITIILTVVAHLLPWLFNSERVIYQWYSIVFAPLILVATASLVAKIYEKRKILFYEFLLVAATVAIIFFPVNVGADFKTPSNYEANSQFYFDSWKEFTLNYGLRDRLNTALYFRPDIEMQQIENHELIYVNNSWEYIEIVDNDSIPGVSGKEADMSDFKDIDIWQKANPNLKLLEYEDAYYLVSTDK
jgi:dolichyl-phosphate-mannose-protein mannosyltransferase